MAGIGARHHLRGAERPTIGDVFLLVLAGHLLGDFVAQTDWQASNKERSWPADLSHVVTYHVIVAGLLLPAWHTWSVVWFLGISASTHALVDRRWPTRLAARFDGQQAVRDRDVGSYRDRPGAPPQHPGDQRVLVVKLNEGG
jgi:Protein of unknown function (DUF3307)